MRGAWDCGCRIAHVGLRMSVCGARWISHDSPGECLLFVSPGLRPPPLPHKKHSPASPFPDRSASGQHSRVEEVCEFRVVLASSGRRGRDNARGHPSHSPSDLTRTSHRDASAPSREQRRGRSPRQQRDHRVDRVVTGPTAPTASSPGHRRRMTGRCSSSITKSSSGIPIRDSRQARWRVSRPAAGIVAASTARRCQDQQTSSRTSSPANVACGHAGRGTARRASLFCEVKEEEAAGRRGTRTRETRPVSRD